jgi:pimeloyl-ACP methyl ester carboxylesterase
MARGAHPHGVTPQVRFARSDGIDIAYQVVGEGPIDLVYVAGSFTHLDVLWELPPYRRYCERLAEFSRLILFDKRGMGMSDRVPGATTLEERMDDLRAVMDAAGSECAALMGESEGGPLSILFAAAHPERARALVLQGAEVRERKDHEWPWGESTAEELEESMAGVGKRWGVADPERFIRALVPSVAPDDWLKDFFLRLDRNAATPAAAEAFMRMAHEIDVRDVVPAIHVPTLVLHRTGDRICDVGNARWLAGHLPDARYIELPGEDHVQWWQPDDVIPEIREFLTGGRGPVEPDRVLATVLFVDLVGSTERAALLGDHAWANLLERYQQTVHREVTGFRGREIDSAGDGFFLSFDAPARAIHCAMAILGAVAALGLQARAGLHAGELTLTGTKPTGIAVHIGARVAALASAGEVLVSSTVRDLVAGSGIEFDERGSHVLKGVPGEWCLFRVKP